MQREDPELSEIAMELTGNTQTKSVLKQAQLRFAYINALPESAAKTDI